MLRPGRLADSGNTPADRTAITEIRSDPEQGDHHNPGHHDRRGRRPIPGGVQHQGRRQARPARVEGLHRVPRPDRGEPDVGPVRVERRGLGELRVRPRGPADPEGSRAPYQASGRVAARPVPGVGGSITMTSPISRPARVGLITDQTGALSFMGIANVNLAKMVTDDINARGGLLGHPVELYVEDSATDDHVAHAAAGRLVREADVDVVVGGIYSSTRQAIKRPVVDEAAKLYIYPEQYEGQESHPLIFCTGPVPAQQVEPFIPWLMRQTGARKFYLPSADYIWPHTLNKKVRDVVTPRGGEIVGEEYFPLDHTDYARVVADIIASDAEVVFNTIVPPGLFTAGSACSGTYRALKMWEAAVTEAGSLDQDEVIAALDYASISEGPGGPAEMVPGQHHVRMNMYIARSQAGTFKVVENLGCIDPEEDQVVAV